MSNITWDDIDKAFEDAGMTKEEFVNMTAYIGSKKFFEDQKALRDITFANCTKDEEVKG